MSEEDATRPWFYGFSPGKESAISDGNPDSRTVHEEQGSSFAHIVDFRSQDEDRRPKPAVSYIGVVADRVDQIIQETRKRDVLDWVDLDRRRLAEEDPFVQATAWNGIWHDMREACKDPQVRVLIIVSPRGYGSTTFTHQFFAREADARLKLRRAEADWEVPVVGRLPLEVGQILQIDLKDAEQDCPTASFLNDLDSYAKNLRQCNSYLVLAVAKELWRDHNAWTSERVRVIDLTEPPDPHEIVAEHLRKAGYSWLIKYAGTKRAHDEISGRNAMEAVRAASTIIEQSDEMARRRSGQPSLARNQELELDEELRGQIENALSDWRDELDIVFGDTAEPGSPGRRPLPLNDRCLLLALALRRCAPVRQISMDARLLQEKIEEAAVNQSAALFSDPGTVFSGRGLRRRITDVGAPVDSQDNIRFDRPGYCTAVLTYVWDNYEIMRPTLLQWLVNISDPSSNDDPVIDTLCKLTFRYGSRRDISDLRAIALKVDERGPYTLGKVLAQAAADEHTGRLAWATLYSWASSQTQTQEVVVDMCRNVLLDPHATVPASKMAMVRLRRVVQENVSGDLHKPVLDIWCNLASDVNRAALVVAEIQKWQRSNSQVKAGKLAMLALMQVERNGLPWLLSDDIPDIDVEAGLHEVFADTELLADTVPIVIEWFRVCSEDIARYERLRDRLLSHFRGKSVFQAGMRLMQGLVDVTRPDGGSIGEDLYENLVDTRLRGVFGPKELDS